MDTGTREVAAEVWVPRDPGVLVWPDVKVEAGSTLPLSPQRVWPATPRLWALASGVGEGALRASSPRGSLDPGPDACPPSVHRAGRGGVRKRLAGSHVSPEGAVRAAPPRGVTRHQAVCTSGLVGWVRAGWAWTLSVAQRLLGPGSPTKLRGSGGSPGSLGLQVLAGRRVHRRQ